MASKHLKLEWSRLGDEFAVVVPVADTRVLLGALFGSVTLLHHAEHLADVPDKRVDRYRMPVLQDGKRVWLEFEEFDITNGVADWPGDYFEAVVEAYLAAGRGRAATVSHAPAYLLEGADLVGFGRAFFLTPGQAHDLQGADALLPELKAACLIADKAYDAERYKERHLVETFFLELKHLRAIATRYDKTKRNFLAAVHLAATTIWLAWLMTPSSTARPDRRSELFCRLTRQNLIPCGALDRR